MNISKEELLKSFNYMNEITKKFPFPENDWQYVAQAMIRFKIILNDLAERKVISYEDKKTLLKNLRHIDYWILLNSPDLDKNKKKERAILLLNESFRKRRTGITIGTLN